jgi:hypothetical protein
VFASRTECYKCGCSKDSASSEHSSEYSTEYGSEESPRQFAPKNRAVAQHDKGKSRPGDWRCTNCDANVFASKNACYQCGTPKRSKAEVFDSYALEHNEEPRVPDHLQQKPGDWKCPGCGANVFASKSSCYRCGRGKTESVQIYPARDGLADNEEIGVFVKNLPAHIEWTQLKDLFEGFDPVHSNVSTDRDGNSRGFGVVKFASIEEAKQAAEYMNGYDGWSDEQPLNCYIDAKVMNRLRKGE